MITRKLLNLMAFLSLAVVTLSITIVFYWLLYPYNPVTFTGENYTIFPKEVKRGETVNYISDYCKYIDIPAVVTRQYIDGLIFIAPSATINRPMGCHKAIFSTTIPSSLPLGEYKMRMIYVFKVNPIKEITIIKDTEQFTVIK
jgi:hypothetical protein